MIFSVLDAFSTLVEVLEEVTLVGELDFLIVRETLVARISSLPHRADLIEQDGSPNVTILYVVEAIVAASDETIDGPGISDFVVLAPVPGQLQLGLLGVAVLANTSKID